MTRNKKNLSKVLFIGGLIFFIGTILVIQGYIQEQLSELSFRHGILDREKHLERRVMKNRNRRLQGDVVRKSRVMRGEDYVESVFYIGEEPVAILKEDDSGMSILMGDIPNGKTKFIDEYRNTYGTEYYRYNKRHGKQKIFYDEGWLMGEAQYVYGELINEKEYYRDGTLRFEVDYSDARDTWRYDGDNEVGMGKLYYPNGLVKFEWNLTKSVSRGYKKTYLGNGELRTVDYFDEWGNKIKSRDNQRAKYLW